MTFTKRSLGAITASTVLIGVFGAGVAGARTLPIAPKQLFTGLVNGHASKAVIVMVCPDPLSPGEKGHPLGTQTLTASPAASTAATVGNTGSKATSIVASFVTTSAAATTSVTFTKYGTLDIPDSFLLPCSGSGSVVFAPAPTSATAKSVRVSVTFGNVSAAS